MKFFRLLALTLLAWCFGAVAQAQEEQFLPSPLVLERAGPGTPLAGNSRSWIDPSGTRDIEAVAAAADTLPWETFAPQRQYRIDGKALWLQFDAVSPANTRWYLVLMHPSVDLVQLFHRGPDGRWVKQSAGQQLPVDEWAIPGRLPTFELAAPGSGTVRYWVRLERERANFSVPLRVYSQSDILELRAFEQFLLGSYFGVIAFLAAASLASATVYRDRNFAALLAYLLAIGAVQLVYLGVGAQHLWTDWPHWNAMARLVVPGPAAAVALWFVKVVTEPARFSRLLDLACWSLIAALLAAVAMNGFLGTRGSFVLVTLLVGATLPMAVTLLVLAWRKGRDPFIGTLVLGFVPMVATAIFPIAYSLNLLPSTMLSRQAFTVGTAIHLPIIFYVLSRRALRRRETVTRASQLTHTDALTGLGDRDTLVHRLEDAIRRAIGQRHQCALLAVRLTNYEALESRLGRATADRALVVSASILRGAAGDMDLAARVGERDFILLLEGPTTGQVALARAQQIVAHGLQHAPVLPPATSLKFHVATILLPDHELDAQRCLQWLDEACDAMRGEPRRAIRSLNF